VLFGLGTPYYSPTQEKGDLMDANRLAITNTQLPLVDMTVGVSISKERRKQKAQKIKVNDMLSQVRQLHEQINSCHTRPNDYISHGFPFSKRFVFSKRNTPRGQRATHSPQVRHWLCLIDSPRQTWARTSIPMGQL
jgi:hypothetical protein